MDVYEGGWQTVLPGGGFPTQYMGADMGLHAEVNTVPWDAVIVEDTPEVVSMRFWIRAARTPFFFEKTLTLRTGSAVLEIEARLTNEGEEPVHCVWGEHIALGAPFLSEDCVIDIRVERSSTKRGTTGTQTTSSRGASGGRGPCHS